MHADHFIWSAYGTWIPSCPRESWPRYIRSWERTRNVLPVNDSQDINSQDIDSQGINSLSLGAGNQSVSINVDPYRVNRLASEKTRRFPPVRFNSMQMQAIADGFERCIRSRQAWVWACSILPDYVQLLITSPRTPASQMMGLMRSEATKRLNELNLHPMTDHSTVDGQTPLMWSHTKWHLQLKDDESIRQAIEYIEGLPEREGSTSQEWNFVREFESLDRCREESEAYEYECQALPEAAAVPC